jgi:molybdopterin synthase sulfur carrier subunit
MVKLVYFAWVRERVGTPEEEVALPDDVRTIADLMAWQTGRSEAHAAAFENAPVLRAAIDRTHVPHDTMIAGAREIAFFPPMTGG